VTPVLVQEKVLTVDERDQLAHVTTSCKVSLLDNGVDEEVVFKSPISTAEEQEMLFTHVTCPLEFASGNVDEVASEESVAEGDFPSSERV
jgi:hypothetical protein